MNRPAPQPLIAPIRPWRIGVVWLLGWLFAAAAGGASMGTARAADFADNFADRPTVTGKSGSARGDNAGATLESREPRHGGKVGGHSVWLSWTAPSDGIVTIDTGGSDFDTLLSVYVLDPSHPERPAMERLREVARGDDQPPALTSSVQFGVQRDTTYEIAVDGYNGDTGNIRLHWDLLAADGPIPTIVQLPPDQSLRFGDAVTLTVNLQAGDGVKLAWLFNGDDVLGVETASLTIPNFQAANVGRYQLRITAGPIRITSDPIELQVNSEGESGTLARDKLFDAADSPLRGRDAALAATPRGNSRGVGLAGVHPSGLGVTRGYDGVQIFNTLYAAREAGEPQHCGVAGGASYWFAYQAPAGGELTLDTAGSSFDTVLAVYTYDPPLLGYQSLVSVTCDNNGGPDGVTSRVSLPVQGGRNYFVAVDGVNGARGNARLNYHLTRTPLDVAPAILAGPSSRTAIAGSTVTWEVVATGTPTPTYQWSFDGTPVVGATNTVLAIPAVQPGDAGVYTVTVTNPAGTVTSAPATLTVLVPPSITQSPAALTVVTGQSAPFTVAATGSLPLAFQWSFEGVPIPGATDATFTLTDVRPENAGTYAVTVTNAAGAVSSAPVVLTVLVPPTITQAPTPLTVAAGQPAAFTVAATGSLPLAFQWSFAGVPIPGATDATFTLTSVRTENAGTYAVTVTNAAGSVASAPVVLTVLAPPTITQAPTPLTVAAGQPAAFTVAATGSLPLAFQWSFEGVPIPGATNATFTLASVRPENAGTYAITVTNAAGSVASAPVVLTVLVPPTITQAPTPLAVAAGQPASLTVAATGSLPLAFQWTFEGVPIPGATNATLTIPSVQPEHAGGYVVVVANPGGTVTTPAAVLSVGTRARLSRPLPNGPWVLKLPAAPGLAYAVEFADRLEPGAAWTPFTEGVADGPEASIEIPAAEVSARYFRFALGTPPSAAATRTGPRR